MTHKTIAGYNLDEVFEQEEARLKAERDAAEAKRRRQELEQKRAERKPRLAPANHPLPVPPSLPPLTFSADFQIENLPDRYRLHHVQYNNSVYVVDWKKELLEQGAQKTQQDWITATKKSEWKIPNLQLYHATFRTLYQQREHPMKKQNKMVEVLRQMFKTDFEPAEPYMMTSTRIKYAADGQDMVTHDVGSAAARVLNVSLVVSLAGPIGWINASSGFEEQMDALLGSRDLAEIETVYNWISGKKPYLYRLNQQPARVEELAAVLRCGTSFNINGYNLINCEGSSRGVVASASKK